MSRLCVLCKAFLALSGVLTWKSGVNSPDSHTSCLLLLPFAANQESIAGWKVRSPEG